MSKKDELEEILENLERLIKRRKCHALGVILYPSSSEEEAKGKPVVCDKFRWLIEGNTTLTLELIRCKFAQELRQFKERDEAIARDIKEQEAKKKK